MPAGISDAMRPAQPLQLVYTGGNCELLLANTKRTSFAFASQGAKETFHAISSNCEVLYKSAGSLYVKYRIGVAVSQKAVSTKPT